MMLYHSSRSRGDRSRRDNVGSARLQPVEISPLEPRLLLQGVVAEAKIHPSPHTRAAHFDKVHKAARMLGGSSTTSSTTTAMAVGSSLLTSVPVLNSKPGASAKLYLDFDGEAATYWDGYNVTATPAYDQDYDPTTFSDAELESIRQIWARVSEKYSPFNINVTTVDPGTYANKVALKVVIGGNGSWTGGTYGGVAYIGSFYTADANVVYVFPDNLGKGSPKYTAEAISHESGHGFGLDHHSSFDSTGKKISEYNSGNSLVAPVMGSSYYAARGLWLNTAATSYTVYQDDLAILSGTSNGFGYSADAVGSSISTASALVVSGSSVYGSGIIEKMTDRDYFSFTTDAGVVSFTGEVAAYGPTLDLKLELWSAGGTLLASADSSSLGETLSMSLPAGSYCVAVASHGLYGDVGQYTIRGSIVTPADYVAAPGNLAAMVTSASQITLAWNDRSDNEDSFVIQRSVDDGSTWSDLAATAANVTSYEDFAVLRGTTYTYRVYARGPADSEYSNTAKATTVPAMPAGLIATAVSTSQINLIWSDVTGETGYRIERSVDGHFDWSAIGSVAADVTSFQDTGLAMGGTYYYRVFAMGMADDSQASNAASATTQVLSVPAAPSNLIATAISKNKIQLTWVDNANNESGFTIQRSTDNVKFVTIATVAANTASYTNSGLKKGKYYYRISAYNEVGSSAFTAVSVASLGQPVGVKALAGSWMSLFSTKLIGRDRDSFRL